MKWIFAVTTGAVLALSSADTIGLHGSGTTNPSKCLWMLASQLMDRTKVPTHVTYRAVGSSTGQKEFLGVNNTGVNAYVPHNDFGAGDIPISTSSYNAFTDNGGEMVHLPFVLGAISIFHNIPNIESGPQGLNLTACNLAKIFKREITVWDDDEILENNPNLQDALPYDDFPITVSRRVHGSSSTSSITKYLGVACPAEWPQSLVGKTIDWPADTEKCEGSGGMTSCLKEIDGAIGYIDSGHGHSQNLKEIELQNLDGNYLSSKEAAAFGGIGAAAGDVPSSADMDFGSVDLLNKPGPYTWPIVAMSYVYVRKDLSFMEPESQTLLIAFLKTLYEPKAIEQCGQFGFVKAPTNVRRVALSGIDMLQADGPTWTVEEDTAPGAGQGDFVISHKRRSYGEYALSSTVGDIADMMAKITELEAAMAEAGTSSSIAKSTSDARQYTEGDAARLNAALGLGAISFVLWAIAIIYILFRKVCGA
jgi:ABC-type phosphate transport system substrate-binding protein